MLLGLVLKIWDFQVFYYYDILLFYDKNGKHNIKKFRKVEQMRKIREVGRIEKVKKIGETIGKIK